MNKTVVVKFETNGGKAVETMTIEYGFMIQIPTSTKIGYQFVNWYLDKNLEIEFDPNKIIEKDLTLYAKWVVYAPKKFINDISAYTNLSNVVRDYQHMYEHSSKLTEDEAIKLKKEKARIDKSNYIHKLHDEKNVLEKDYEIALKKYNEQKEKSEKLKQKKDKKVARKGESKSQKIIFIYNEQIKKEGEMQSVYLETLNKLKIIESKYEEFASKNR